MGTCHLCGHHRWRPSRVMPTVKEIACCMWCGHWPTSIVNPIHGTAYLAWGSWLLFFARNPFPDVRRTVAKRDTVSFARPQESDNISIHENYVLEIQHEGQSRRFSGEDRGQFANVVRYQSTAHPEHDVIVCTALDSQHRSSRRQEGNGRTKRKMLNLNMLDGLSIGEISPMVKCWATKRRISSSPVALESGSC